MRHEDLYLVDIIEAAAQIDQFLHHCDAQRFTSDDLNQSAVVWKLIVIGEASIKLAPDTKNRFSDIPWERIKGFRNRLVHGYFTLKWEEVWRVASVEVPRLREQAERILATDYPETYRKLLERQNQKPNFE